MKPFSMISLAAAAVLSGPLLAQAPFPANGTTVTLGFTRQVEDYVIPPSDWPDLIQIALRGGTGGQAERRVNPYLVAEGGRGARVEASFVVGTGPNDLRPGGTLRFIVGEQAPKASKRGSVAAGGGGGTGVLYRAPGFPDFVPLLVAGGGGGGAANNFAGTGTDGAHTECGTANGHSSSGAAGCAGGGGGLALHYTNSTGLDYGGGGGGVHTGGFPVGEWNNGAAGMPAGGAGGENGWSSTGRGGWGCGGGGAGNRAGGGGGGGYSGGGGAYWNGGGGGGGSYMNPQYSRSTRTDSYDGRGQGYARFTPLESPGETIELAVPLIDPLEQTALRGLVGPTGNFSTLPLGYTSPCSPPPTKDVWYRYTNPTNCTRDLAFENDLGGQTPLELTLGITPSSYAGARCFILPSIPFGTGGQTAVESVAPGATIWLRIAIPDGYNQNADYRLGVTWTTPTWLPNPVIVTQPQDASVDVGGQQNPAMMSVVAQNATRYQWYRRDDQFEYQEVVGQTSATLNIPFVQCGDAGYYKCRAFGGCFGSVDSEPAFLFVGPLGGVLRTGSSCGPEALFVGGTFYEWFLNTPTGFDLHGRSLRFRPEGDDWRMSDDGSGFDLNFQNGLGLGDDQLSRGHALGFTFPMPGGGSTTTIDISSNGWIGMDTGAHAGSQYQASIQNMLQGAARIAACWTDLNPAAGGEVYFDAFPDRALITWVDVPEFRNTRLNSFQVQLFPNGEFVLVYAQLFGARAPLIGYSTGGVSVDPGTTNLSDYQMGPDLNVGRFDPALGETFEFEVTVDGPVTGGIVNLGFAPVNLDLTLFGLPGCRLRSTGDVSFNLPPFAAGRSSLTVPIPPSPNLLASVSYAQAIVIEPGANALGIMLSNGLTLTVGGCAY